MSLERKEIFEFGEFRLDVDEHTIERIDGKRNGTLTEKAFQALVLLVRRRGHLVSKDELIQCVWPDTIVEDNNLEKCVHHIRQFLGETSEGTKYIETVRKHGYRFVGKVKAIEVSSSWLPETFRTFDKSKGPADLIADRFPKSGDESENPAGIGLAVLERPRVRFWRAIVLLSIVLVLMGAMTGLGYYRFIRSSVEADAAQILAKRGTNNDEAYRSYLLAMNVGEERGVQNVLRSREYFEQAVELDPNYARAWAGLALIHNDIVGHTDSGQPEHYQSSMEAIRRALAIDPNLSEAYSSLCNNKNTYEYDVSGAEMACKRAVELDPNSPVAHKTYAKFLYTRGKFADALVEIKTAMDLQPVSYRNQQIYALTLYFARQYDESEAQFKRLIELNPNQSAFIHGRLIRVLEEQGKESEAFEYLVRMLTIQKADDTALERLKDEYRTRGWRGVMIERIKTAEADPAPSNFGLACLNAKIGKTDRALEYLEKAYQERSFQIAILKVEPQLDSLRSDPRFDDLVRRAGLN